MEEIKREKKKEITEVITIYKASDGEEFENAQECRKYEDSAAFKLMSRVREMSIKKNPVVEDWLDGEENEYMTVVPKSKEDIDILNHVSFMFGGRRSEEGFFKDSMIGVPIIVGYRIYESKYDWVWFTNIEDAVKEMTDGKYELKLVEEKK